MTLLLANPGIALFALAIGVVLFIILPFQVRPK